MCIQKQIYVGYLTCSFNFNQSDPISGIHPVSSFNYFIVALKGRIFFIIKFPNHNARGTPVLNHLNLSLSNNKLRDVVPIHPCDWLSTFPPCSPPLGQCQFGLAPALLRPSTIIVYVWMDGSDFCDIFSELVWPPSHFFTVQCDLLHLSETLYHSAETQ